jgi:asparagine synthase (glutamine-hydrolysing)
MCGILGIVAKDHDGGGLQEVIRRMGLWQYHRGPDGWGEWQGDGVVLGQNRLAILDLVHGKQPMSSADGSVHVVFNGEIYNYRALWQELAAKGYEFRTDHSDTEVIVHGYREWGTGVFDRLEGMFAIAIWDAHREALFLARDALGIKPLYHALTDDGLVFASEPKTILAGGQVTRELNAAALPDYFMFRAPIGPETLFAGIQKLSPGCWRRYDRAGGLSDEVVYWRPHARRSPTGADVGEAEVEAVLEEAVRSHLIADVPVGLFLSGGVDSSLLAALLAPHVRIEAFAVGTASKWDESGFAQQVADHLGLPLHVRWVTGEDFRDRFDDWSYYNDDPVADPSALALMLLSQYARDEGMKVMLAGEGSDEIFGGYYSYLRYKGYAELSRVPLAARAGAVAAPRAGVVDGDYLGSLGDLRFFGSAHVLSETDRRSLFRGETAGLVYSWSERRFRPAGSTSAVARAAMVSDQTLRLPNDLLPRTDRATMAYSLEGRVPYLDRKVVDLANSLTDRQSVRLLPPQAKWLLKRIAARHVPRNAVYRHKRGFNVPVEQWLSVDFRDRVDEFLAERRIDALDYEYLAAVRQEHDAGRHRAALLWAWLVLEQWHRLWLDGEASPRPPAVVADRSAYELLRAAEVGQQPAPL